MTDSQRRQCHRRRIMRRRRALPVAVYTCRRVGSPVASCMLSSRAIRLACSLLAVVLVGLVVLSTPPSPPGLFPPSAFEGSGRKVAIVGDSLIFAIEEDGKLTSALREDGYSTSISATAGAGTDDLSLVDWAAVPDVLVIALGSNDPDVPVAQKMAEIEAHVAKAPDACLVLVGVTHTYPALAPMATEMNKGYLDRSDQFLAWSLAVSERPGFVGDDLLHHTAAGENAYRASIHHAIKLCTR